MPLEFLRGVRDGFSGGPCRAQGERYPGCPLDQIEPRQHGRGDTGETLRIAQLEAEDAQNQVTLAEAREVIAGLLADKQQLEQRVPDFGPWQRAIAEREHALDDIAAERNALVTKLNALTTELAVVTANKDRFKASGQRIVAEQRDTRAIFEIPGVLDAAQKAARLATHPDKGHTEAAKRALTAKFQESEAAFERIRNSQKK